jgi:hypothetical protein
MVVANDTPAPGRVYPQAKRALFFSMIKICISEAFSGIAVSSLNTAGRKRLESPSQTIFGEAQTSSQALEKRKVYRALFTNTFRTSN